MKALYPTDLPEFLRQFRWNTIKLRRWKFDVNSNGEIDAHVIVALRKQSSTLNASGAVVLLKLQMLGVEEYRFQKRPADQRMKTTMGRVGSFQGLIFIDFDAYALSNGEVAKVHDYRASDSFIACRDLNYTILEKNTQSV